MQSKPLVVIDIAVLVPFLSCGSVNGDTSKPLYKINVLMTRGSEIKRLLVNSYQRGIEYSRSFGFQKK